jgi:Glycosyl transferase family 2
VLPAGGSAGTSEAEASKCLSDLCSSVSICGSSLPARKATVSLTMIVRNEESDISVFLSSVAGLFDVIVVVDTGSKDRTREIAREFGARVFDSVWIEDFAAAESTALTRATGIMPSGSMPMMSLTRQSRRS